MSPSTACTRASRPRLELGKVTITDAATAALERTGTQGVLLLARHLHGNWGDLCEQDALQNELALLLGLRVLSCYAIADGIRIDDSRLDAGCHGPSMPGALMGAMFGGAAGCAAGSAVGKAVNTNVLDNYECQKCGHIFGGPGRPTDLQPVPAGRLLPAGSRA